jgi:hypothetical protein
MRFTVYSMRIHCGSRAFLAANLAVAVSKKFIQGTSWCPIKRERMGGPDQEKGKF